MKKIFSLVCCLICLGSILAFADSCMEEGKSTMLKPPAETCFDNNECNFMCLNIKKCDLYKSLSLSETQICRADKIQGNYEFDSLSIREKIKCEEEALQTLLQKCACDSEIKSQKKKIKALNKELKKICKCYEDEFKELLSDNQEKQYKKFIKNNRAENKKTCKKCSDCDD